jgi:RES domain-containing protein
MKATTINYTLPSGRTAIIRITPTNFRGQIHAATTATVDGVGTPILGGRTKPAGMPVWAVSCIGKLPLTAEIDAQVAAAEAAINTAHTKHNAVAAAHVAELDAISANSAMIARRMAY